MDWNAIISDVFQVVLIPLLGLLVSYFIKWVNARAAQLKANAENETQVKYINMLTATITNAVVATNQTYVNSLKQQGRFDAEAQKKAFEMTLEAVKATITDEACKYLEEALCDIDKYINTQIEAIVSYNKAHLVPQGESCAMQEPNELIAE